MLPKSIFEFYYVRKTEHMKKTTCSWLALCYFLLPFVSYAQLRFNPYELTDHRKHGKKIASSMATLEVFEYQKTADKAVYLKNGLRASSFVNEVEWLKIKDTVDVTTVEIVYSRYPLRKGVYHEIYPLLFDRLNALFRMDPDLNDSSINFKKVLQTNCVNDNQVKGLYHGIVIHYTTMNQVVPEDVSGVKTSSVSQLLLNEQDVQSTIEDLEATVENLLESPFLSDTIKSSVINKPLDEQISLLKEYLLEEIQTEPDHILSEATPEERTYFEGQVGQFLKSYSNSEPVIQKVFDRHPEWKSILVVNDWTGSMYGFGAQVLEWHLKNFERSEIISLTLFNDGDDKPDHEKNPGQTGGIYFEPADNVPQLVDLFNYVILKGSGGDAPENNIEAILKAIEQFPKFSEIVMIADNNSCVRDIALADRIGVPVRVVLCGYDPKRGVNPHYIYLAKTTGGGIYTIEEDLENIDVDLKEGGEIGDFRDKRFKLNKNGCSYIHESETILSMKVYTLDEGLKDKKKVINLDASKQNLEKIPLGIFKMHYLSDLNLSENQLSSVKPSIKKLAYLKKLDLSLNKLSALPVELSHIRYLETLKLSGNQFDSIPPVLYSMKNLRHLNLSDNRIEKFDIYTLTRLQSLDLSGNGLTTITKSTGKLKQLRYLDLANNSLTEVPVSIGSMRKLKELDLSGNSIQTMPDDLKKFINLRTLRLHGNPISEAEKDRIRATLKYTQIIF